MLYDTTGQPVQFAGIPEHELIPRDLTLTPGPKPPPPSAKGVPSVAAVRSYGEALCLAGKQMMTAHALILCGRPDLAAPIIKRIAEVTSDVTAQMANLRADSFDPKHWPKDDDDGA